MNLSVLKSKEIMKIRVSCILDSIYNIYHIYNMVKTLRISDENHKEILKIQGQIQAKSGEFTGMDLVIEELIKTFKKRK